MMKPKAAWRWCLAAAALLAMTACAQTPAVMLEGTQSRLLSPEPGGREYRISLYVPPGVPPAAGWPVIYALDGATTFATFTDVVRVQSQRPEVTGMAAAVVVGIAYATPDGSDSAQRGMDLTPGPASGESGGADGFLNFIENTLKPLVERDLPIDRRRQTLFGHSLGGLFALHVLFTRPDSFQTYVAASPSIWWRDRFILAEAKAAPPQAGGSPAVLITVGEFEQFPPADKAATADKLRQRAMVDNAAQMAERLAASGCRVQFHRFPGENHGSVLPAAISRAARFALGR